MTQLLWAYVRSRTVSYADRIVDKMERDMRTRDFSPDDVRKIISDIRDRMRTVAAFHFLDKNMPRFGVDTSNAVESINKTLKSEGARSAHTVMEVIKKALRMMHDIMFRQRALAVAAKRQMDQDSTCQDGPTPYAKQLVANEASQAPRATPPMVHVDDYNPSDDSAPGWIHADVDSMSGEHVFEVRVNPKTRECSCSCRWPLEFGGMPCRHVMSVIMYVCPNGNDTLEHVGWYPAHMCVSSWHSQFVTGSPNVLPTTECAMYEETDLRLPEEVKGRAGRPKKKRLVKLQRIEKEHRVAHRHYEAQNGEAVPEGRQLCSLCHELGHDRLNCAKSGRCGLCNQRGHNRVSCTEPSIAFLYERLKTIGGKGTQNDPIRLDEDDEDEEKEEEEAERLEEEL